MRKITKRIIGIAVGLLLWGFFSIQEELAFYGIYYLISYGVYEISSFIPFICLFATLIWLIILIKQILQKKITNKWFALLLVVLLVFQARYFYTQKQERSAMMVVTIQSVDDRNGTITVTNADGDEKCVIVLEALDLFRNMVVVGEQQYLASYDYHMDNPNEGKLSRLMIIAD